MKGLALAASLTLCACATAREPEPAGPPEPLPAEAALSILAEPIPLNPRNPAQRRVGQLDYAWGVELTAAGTSRFGGLSGLETAPASAPDVIAFTAVTDEGDLISFEAPSAGATAVLSGVVRPLKAEDGGPLSGKTMGDAEDLTRSPFTTTGLLVSFERTHRVLRFDEEGRAEAGTVTFPPSGDLSDNEGFEAIAVLPLSGRVALAVGAEDGRIWLCPSEGPGECSLFLNKGGPEPGYKLTALDHLPGTADLVATYRAFDPIRGARVIVAWISTGFAGGANRGVVPLAKLAPPLTSENFEAVSAVGGPEGYRLYLVSDDNFSPKQRTLLLAFDWKPSPAP